MRRPAFTLIELLTVIAIIAILGAILIPVTSRIRHSSNRAQCIGNLRQLAAGVLLYANDHNGELPRSNHSAYAHRQRSWLSTIQPYLGGPEGLKGKPLDQAIERYCRCPGEEGRKRGSSYGLNVHFELSPEVDDYEGAPTVWRRTLQIPAPSHTILLAELRPDYEADHIMAHYWTGNVNGAEVDADRHNGQANYAFVDGHVESLRIEQVFSPQNKVNHWNPATAERL